MARTINYNDSAFRALFPAFADTTAYPQATIQAWWNQAILYISNVNGGCFFGSKSLAQQTQACNQMTAHLMQLNIVIQTGQIPSMVNGATIDKISVTLQPPPVKTQWGWWLSLTAYGQALLALLAMTGAGGMYISAAPPGRAGFPFGVF